MSEQKDAKLKDLQPKKDAKGGGGVRAMGGGSAALGGNSAAGGGNAAAGRGNSASGANAGN
ncbi:MAG: hypothetical protein M3R59_06550 [Verrucomicrobiota bacterium]|nr:hypothetical protein [Verrucomicrobiota bacterium]